MKISRVRSDQEGSGALHGRRPSKTAFAVPLLMLALAGCGAGKGDGGTAENKGEQVAAKEKVDPACTERWNANDSQVATWREMQLTDGFAPEAVSVGRVTDYRETCLVTVVTAAYGYQYTFELDGTGPVGWQGTSDIPVADLPDSVTSPNAAINDAGELVDLSGDQS